MAGKKVLVADDSLTIQKVIKLALSNEGYEIKTVSNGNEAVQEISLFRPDVVLIDVSLPGKNAFEVKQAVNTGSLFEEMKFILMSSAFEKVDEAQERDSNFHGRLTKPFDPAHLRQLIAEVLGVTHLQNRGAAAARAASPGGSASGAHPAPGRAPAPPRPQAPAPRAPGAAPMPQSRPPQPAPPAGGPPPIPPRPGHMGKPKEEGIQPLSRPMDPTPAPPPSRHAEAYPPAAGPGFDDADAPLAPANAGGEAPGTDGLWDEPPPPVPGDAERTHFGLELPTSSSPPLASPDDDFAPPPPGPAHARSYGGEEPIDITPPMQSSPEPMDLGPPSGSDQSDIRQLTESTIRMSGLDDMGWNVDESVAGKPMAGSEPVELEDPFNSDGPTRHSVYQPESEPSLPPSSEMMSHEDPAGFYQPEDAPLEGENELTPLAHRGVPVGSILPPHPEPQHPPRGGRGATSSHHIPAPPPPSAGGMSASEMEEIIRAQLEDKLREMAQKIIPDVAEKIIKAEIRKMLSEQP